MYTDHSPAQLFNFVDHVMVRRGDRVTGFYDAAAPVPMIYPPQYVAIVMAKNVLGRNVTVDYFGRDLVSADGGLKLNIGPNTVVMLENAQAFSGMPVGRDLVVVYSPITRSIPPQTTPYPDHRAMLNMNFRTGEADKPVASLAYGTPEALVLI